MDAYEQGGGGNGGGREHERSWIREGGTGWVGEKTDSN